VDTDGAVMREAAGSLPVTLTSLVGRQRELAELAAMLPASRLVTLAGTGGSGKTRLSIALASAQRHRFSHGAWWVDLAGVTGREQLPGTVAAALGVPQTPGQDTTAAVVRHLRSRTALLVLDNCEQVVAGCAELVERLLTACAGVTVVATSRELLGVPGERVFRVDGLGLPAADEDAADAVQLFTERAGAITPGYTLDPVGRTAVARLCRQLDGLPLAIELAAARAGILGAAEIARRLRGDTGLLRNPSRSAPERHQTLQATLEWSYRLLSEQEQVLFRRLSCFSGSFSLPAAEAVAVSAATALGEVADADAAGRLAALVGKSLVLVAAGGDPEYRYRMLETIRAYGADVLAASGEQAAVHAAHAAYYLSVATRAQAGLEGADQARWLDQLGRDHDNIRAVLGRTLGSAEPVRSPASAPAMHSPATRSLTAHSPASTPAIAGGSVNGTAELGARMAALMWPFWYRRGDYHEARAWLERAAEIVLREPVAAQVIAAVLTGAGVLAFLQCDYAVAAERLTKARAVYEEEGDQVGLATTLQRLGSIAREEGRYADARTLHEESMAIWEGLADPAGVAASQDYLAFTAWLAGEATRAVELSAAAVAAFRAGRLRQETAAALVNQGVAVWLAGDPERGGALLQESLDIATRLGYQEGIAWALNELAVIIADDDPETAADMLAESLEIHASLGDRWRVASVTEAIAGLAARPDLAGAAGPAIAATILGGAAALRESLGTPVPPAERTARDRCVRSLREQLGRGFPGTWDRGQAMTLEELIDASLRAARLVQDPLTAQAGPAAEGAAGQPGAGSAPAALYGLTERELDVLRLLSAGLTNRQVGARLQISTGTAGVHVSNILRKLGASSRAQAVGVAHRLGIGERGTGER
jgi:predicted ATPase/DNA-binding CsgD family transcriptional regulator